jgi:hypothetical protein
MYFIGLDVHKKTIGYCVKDASGHVHQEDKVGATRGELDGWIKTLPQPRTIRAPGGDALSYRRSHGWTRVIGQPPIFA